MTQPSPAAGASLLRIPALRAVVVLSVLGFSSFFLTLSSLPVWAVSGGVPEALAGLVTTVMLAATVGTQLTVPALVRRYGLPRVLGVGLMALGIPTPLLLVCSDLWWLLLVSAVRGTGFAVLTVLLPIVVTQTVPAGRHGAAIGLYGLAIAVPNLLVVPAAVALTGAGQFPVVAILGVLPVLALPAVRHLGAARTTSGDDCSRGDVAGPSAAARPPRERLPVGPLAGITSVLLAVTLAGGGLLAILPVTLGSGALATVTLLVFGVTAAAARWWAGTLADRRGPGRLLVASVLIGVLGLVVMAMGLAMSDGLRTGLLLAGAGLFGLSYGAVQNLTLLIGFAVAGPDRQEGASAIWNAGFDTGTAIGALVVGALAAFADLGVGLLVCAGLVALALVPGIRAVRVDRRGR